LFWVGVVRYWIRPNFADLLDGVEHRGEHYTIVRRGKAVAHLEPVSSGRGADVKSLLRRYSPDAAWPNDLAELRAVVEIEDRE
jgi:antitoxin (DNA-binding transcriptional repressor) of toxin-antitoxin stability system